MLRSFRIAAIAMLLAPWSARADLVTLTSSQSTTIFSESENSNGQGSALFSGRTNGGGMRRGLIQFDVAGAVPAGATITSVSLQMTLSNVPPSAGAAVIELRPLLASWGEGSSMGSGGGAAAGSGDATWTKRIFNTTDWTAPGGDFAPTASATTTVTGAKDSAVVWSSAQMASDAQSWLDSPSTNFGWLLLNQNEGTVAQSVRGFYTEEAETFTPQLSVTFTPAAVPEPSSIVLVGLAAAGSAAAYRRRRNVEHVIHAPTKAR